MDSPDSSFCLRLEMDEDEENGNGEKTQVIVQAEDGKYDQERGQGELVLAATAAEGGEKEELSEESQVVAAVVGPEDYENCDADTSRDDRETMESQEPIPAGMWDPEDVLPVAVQFRPRRMSQRFTQWQLQELERIFQKNHRISGEARTALARWMGVTEALVRRWFKNRRGQHRSQRQ